jgi:hypothetical protein
MSHCNFDPPAVTPPPPRVASVDTSMYCMDCTATVVNQTLAPTTRGGLTGQCHSALGSPHISPWKSQATLDMTVSLGLMVRTLVHCLEEDMQQTGAMYVHIPVVLAQEAKYVERWPNTASAWAGWSRFDIPVDRYAGVHSLLIYTSNTLGSPTCHQASQQENAY